MQTFLPYADISKSVRCLDNKRLGKQRVEAMQILKALSDPTYGWQSHPAVNMWRGYDRVLTQYMNAAIWEWEKRGFHNTMMFCVGHGEHHIADYPWWWGAPIFHRSHRSALLAKNYEWYSQFEWYDTPEINYVWPYKELKRV